MKDEVMSKIVYICMSYDFTSNQDFGICRQIDK